MAADYTKDNTMREYSIFMHLYDRFSNDPDVIQLVNEVGGATIDIVIVTIIGFFICWAYVSAKG